MKLSSQKIKLFFSLLILLFGWTVEPSMAQSKKKTIVFDTFHGQNANHAETFNSLLPENSGSAIELTRFAANPI